MYLIFWDNTESNIPRCENWAKEFCFNHFVNLSVYFSRIIHTVRATMHFHRNVGESLKKVSKQTPCP